MRSGSGMGTSRGHWYGNGIPCPKREGRAATLFCSREPSLGRGRVRDVEEQGAYHRGNDAEKGEPVEAAGVAIGQILDHPDIPRPEETAEVSDRVDPGNRG